MSSFAASRSDEEPLSTGGRLGWAFFGLVFPLIAFAADSAVHVDPVLWGELGGRGLGGSPRVLGVRQVVVYGLLALSLLGTTLALARPKTLLGNGLTITLLTIAVLFGLTHAIAYIPMVPLFFMGIMLIGLGLLGFAPYAASWVWISQLSDCLKRQARLAQGRLRWALVPLLAAPVVIAVALSPLVIQHQALEQIRGGEPAQVSAGLASLGPFAEFSQAELAGIYPSLSAESQIRLRNHYLELFDRDVHADMSLRFR